MKIDFDWNTYYKKHVIFSWSTFWEEYARAHREFDEHTLNIRPDDYDYAKAFRDLDTILHFDATHDVLDVGCGTGDMTHIVSKCVNSIQAIDSSQTMTEIAKERFGLSVQKASVLHMPFPDAQFDITYSLGVFQYVSPDLFEKSVQECIRVTKKGGKILFGDIPESAPPESAINTYQKEIWRRFGVLNTYFYNSYFENRLHVLIINN